MMYTDPNKFKYEWRWLYSVFVAFRTNRVEQDLGTRIIEKTSDCN